MFDPLFPQTAENIKLGPFWFEELDGNPIMGTKRPVRAVVMPQGGRPVSAVPEVWESLVSYPPNC